MIQDLKYEQISDEEAKDIYGTGIALGFGLVATFGIVAAICVVIYKLFGAKKAEISLPGGFKFEFDNR